mmetsp:Transcript_26561/g.73013  ORF Transcript_26561/g.73013 Transcript_26561/m.73013 type:complete len:444 (+) Transcript_26561:69-1400(+)
MLLLHIFILFLSLSAPDRTNWDSLLFPHSIHPHPLNVLRVIEQLGFPASARVALFLGIFVGTRFRGRLVVQDTNVHIALLDFPKASVGLPVEHGRDQNLVGPAVGHNGNVPCSRVIVGIVIVIVVVVVATTVVENHTRERSHGSFLDNPYGFSLRCRRPRPLVCKRFLALDLGFPPRIVIVILIFIVARGSGGGGSDATGKAIVRIVRHLLLDGQESFVALLVGDCSVPQSLQRTKLHFVKARVDKASNQAVVAAAVVVVIAAAVVVVVVIVSREDRFHQNVGSFLRPGHRRGCHHVQGNALQRLCGLARLELSGLVQRNVKTPALDASLEIPVGLAVSDQVDPHVFFRTGGNIGIGIGIGIGVDRRNGRQQLPQWQGLRHCRVGGGGFPTVHEGYGKRNLVSSLVSIDTDHCFSVSVLSHAPLTTNSLWNGRGLMVDDDSID